MFAFECFVIPAADFTQSGVQSASLNTTVTSTTPTCGFFHVPPPLPLTISATWTGTSPVVTQSSEGTASCMTFSTESTGSTTTNGATGTATLSPLFPDTITGQFGDMINADVTIHTQGVDPDPCIFRN